MIKLPKRYAKTGVGKFIGGRVYFHKNYVDRFMSDPVFCKGYDFLERACTKEPEIISYEIKTGIVSFIWCSDWDEAPEPSISGRVVYNEKLVHLLDTRNFHDSNPFIYHHKWLFVSDNYKGFDVEESKKRSLQWMALKPDCRKIGRKKYWEEVIIPQLEKE
jgi:hypothetical protein